MKKKKYLPLEKKFDCKQNRHDFGEVANLSVLKEWDSPVVQILLMQTGETECKLCHRVLMIMRNGPLWPENGRVVPKGDWYALTEEDLKNFNALKEFRQP